MVTHEVLSDVRMPGVPDVDTAFRRPSRFRSDLQRIKEVAGLQATTDEGQDCCVEVKTARSRVGILDVVASVYNRLKLQSPNWFSFRLVVSHYWDNTVTPEQKDFLGAFVASLSRTRIGGSHQVGCPSSCGFDADRPLQSVES
jgi:hypothetical protein